MSLPVGLPALTDSDLVGQVARILTQAVVQGRLPPGSKVVEAGIARELGISRAPVREAARLLEKQGLLVAKPRRGFFVRKLEIRNIDEIYDLRICIERHASVLASRNLTARRAGRAAGGNSIFCTRPPISTIPRGRWKKTIAFTG